MSTISIRGRDWVRVHASMRDHAVKLYGIDEPTRVLSSRGLVQPVTPIDYAASVYGWWRDVGIKPVAKALWGSKYDSMLDEGGLKYGRMPIAAMHSIAKFEGNPAFKDIAQAASRMSLAISVLSGAFLGGIAARKIDERVVLNPVSSVQLWEASSQWAAHAGQIDARVTADETWLAFKEGAREGVDNVKQAVKDTAAAAGQALGEAAALAGQAAGKGLAGFLSGAGVVTVAAIGAGGFLAYKAGAI